MSGAMSAAEHVTAQVTGPESLSAESRATAAHLAENYRVSPLDMVPNPSPLLVESTEEVAVPTPNGLFGLRAWRFADGAEHLSARALDRDGTPVPYEGGGVPAVRIHSECATGDIFGSFRCDCGPQLENGLRIIGRTGGYLVYVRNHEGRGIGLVNNSRPSRERPLPAHQAGAHASPARARLTRQASRPATRSVGSSAD